MLLCIAWLFVSVMSAVERGTQNPGVMASVKIAKAIDVPVSELFAPILGGARVTL